MSTMSKIARRWTSRLLIFVLVFMTAAGHIGVVESKAAQTYATVTYGFYSHRSNKYYDDCQTILRTSERVYSGDEALGNFSVPLRGYKSYGWYPYITEYRATVTHTDLLPYIKAYSGSYTTKSNPRPANNSNQNNAEVKITLTYSTNSGGTVSPVSETTNPGVGNFISLNGINKDVAPNYNGSPFNLPGGAVAWPQEGYKFTGWYKGNALITTSTELTREDLFNNRTNNTFANTTYVAKFEQSTDVILYHASTDMTMGYVDIPSQNLTENGGTVSAVTAIARDGYDFVKWTDEADGTVSTSPILTVAKINEYAKNTDGTYKRAVFKAVFEEKSDAIVTFNVNNDAAGTVKHRNDTEAKSSTTEAIKPATGVTVVVGSANDAVTATNVNGCTFLYWKNEDGDIISYDKILLKNVVWGQSLAVKSLDFNSLDEFVYEDTTLTAYFKEADEADILFRPTAIRKGRVSSATESDKWTITQLVDGTTTFPEDVTATTLPGFKFAYWSNTKNDTKFTEPTITRQQIESIVKTGDTYESGVIFRVHYDEIPGKTISFVSDSGTKGLVKTETDASAAASTAQFFADDDSSGETVSVTAIPNKGYKFRNWTVTVDGNTTTFDNATLSKTDIDGIAKKDGVYTDGIKFYANFDISVGTTLTFETTDENQGKVQQGTDSPAKSTTQTIENTDQVVDVEAQSRAGYEFLYWTDATGAKLTDGSGADLPAKLTAETIIAQSKDADGNMVDKVFRAVFKEKDDVTVRYTAEPSTMGTISYTDKNTSELKTGTVLEIPVAPATGTLEDVTAKANRGYKFIGWTNVRGKSVTTDVTLTGSMTKIVANGVVNNDGIYQAGSFTAKFSELDKVSLTFKAEAGKGTVSTAEDSAAESIAKPLNPQIGEAIDVTATAATGYVFDHWSVEGEGGALTEVSKEHVLGKEIIDKYKDDKGTPDDTTDDEYKAVTFVACFVEDQASISFTNAHPDRGSIDLPETQKIKVITGDADVKSVTAKPNAGYKFAGWKDSSGATVTTEKTLSDTLIQSNAKDENGHYVDTVFTAEFSEGDAVTYTYVVDEKEGEIVDGTSPETGVSPVPTSGGPAGVTVKEKAGYTFKGWSVGAKATTDSDIISTEKKLDATAMGTHAKATDGAYKSTTFYANFTENDPVEIQFVSSDSTRGQIQISGSTTKDSDKLSVEPVTGGSKIKTVTAIAKDGYRFENWTVNVGIDTVTITDAVLDIDAINTHAKAGGIYVARTFTANFVERDHVVINYVADGGLDSGEVHDGAGHVIPNAESYNPGTESAKGSTATAHAGYVFKYWKNSKDSTTSPNEVLDATYVDTIAKNGDLTTEEGLTTTFTAVFEEKQAVNVVFNVADESGATKGGSISATLPDTGHTTGTSITQTLKPATDTAVEVRAAEAAGYNFDGWYVGTELVTKNHVLTTTSIDGKAKTETVGPTKAYVATTFTAKFSEKADAKLSFGVDTGMTGMGSISYDTLTDQSTITQNIPPATGGVKVKTVMAVEKAGYEFTGWYDSDGNRITTADPYTISVSEINAHAMSGGIYEDTTFTARFKERGAVDITFRVGTAEAVEARDTGEVSATDYATGASIIQPIAPVSGASAIKAVTASPKDGYEFTGWTKVVGGMTTEVADKNTPTLDATTIATHAKQGSVFAETVFVANFKEKDPVDIIFEVATTEPVQASSTGELSSEGYTTGSTITQKTKPATGSPQAVTASAKAGYRFIGWSVIVGGTTESITGTDSQVLDATTISTYAKSGSAYVATRFVANFEERGDAILTFAASGSGKVSIDGAAALASDTQKLGPATDTAVSVKAIADDGYRFTGWSVVTDGGTVDIAGEDELELSVAKIDQYAKTEVVGDTSAYVDTRFIANFVEKAHVTLSYRAGEHGTLVVEGSETDTYSKSINPQTGQMPLATAKADIGYHFSKWQVDGNQIVGATATLKKEDIDSAARVGTDYVARQLVAIFEEDPDVTINYTTEDSAKGTVTRATETIAPVSEDPLGSTAVPEEGYEFDGWYDESDELVSSSEKLEPARDADGLNVAATYEARFRRYSSDINMGPAGSSLEIISTLTGDVPSSYSESFAYSVVAGAGSPTVTGSLVSGAFTSVGSKYLSGISMTVDDIYTDVTLTISQNAGTNINVAYDKSEYVVTYDIVRNGKKYEMADIVITQTKDSHGAAMSAEVSGIEFVNDYTVPSFTVTKTTDATYATVGDTITYKITVTNIGEVAASSATITDIIGDGLEYVSSSPAGSDSSSTVTWDGQYIGVGQTKEYTVTVRVTDSVGDTIKLAGASVLDTTTEARGESVADARALPVHKLPTTAAYTAIWSRLTAATESSERDGVYGFIRGNLVEMEASITNESSMTLSMDVMDDFLQSGVFSDIEVKAVTASKYTSVPTGTGVRVTIEPGTTATVRFAAQVQANIDNYDSEAHGDAGYTNEVSISDVVAIAQLADGTTISYSKDGSVAGSIAWTGSGDPLGESTISGTVPTRKIDIMVTHSFDINWADVVPTYRPSSVDVELIRVDEDGNYIETVEEKTLTSEDRTSSDVWSTTFEPHPAYDNVEGLVVPATPAVAARYIAARSVATASQASASEADEESSDGTLPDGTLLDDTDVDEGGFASRYIMGRAEGLIDSPDLGDPIYYTVRIVSEVVEGYTRSEVTSVGEKFEVTEYRPWTPRQISTSGIRKDDSRSGSIIVDAKDGTKTVLGSVAGISAGTSAGTSTSAGGTTPIGATRDYVEAGSAGAWHVINTAGTAGGTSGATAGTTASTTDGAGTNGSVGAATADGSSAGDGASGIGITILSSLSALDDATDKDIKFMQADGSYLTDDWALISSGLDESGSPTYSWYHFGSDGTLDTGWLLDTTGEWYYLSESTDSSVGSLATGWILDSQDGRWYYLEPSTGAMATGWKYIDSKWYYFTEGTPIETWQYNTRTRKWVYKGLEGDRPYGSMYRDEQTPDGSVVSEDGELRG